MATTPRSGWLKGVSRNTASSVKTEATVSTSPRSQPLPNVSINVRNVSVISAMGQYSPIRVSSCERTSSTTHSERCTMLKRMLATTALLAFCTLPLAAQQAAAAASDMTITGQVVDVNCFTTMGASGAGHKACATACAKAGVALAILSSDGTLYMPVSAKPGDPQNSRLSPFAEGKVKVTGTHRMASGMHTIEIKTIAAAT